MHRWLPLGVAIFTGFMVAMAHAHGDAAWIQAGDFKNRMGELCCGERDCRRLDDGDVTTSKAGYFIHSLDVTLPYTGALPVSPSGYWICVWGGSIKCFFSPSMGS